MKPTDVRVRDVSLGYEDYSYRSPIKFGGMVLDRVTLLNVEMTVETRGGKVAKGFGSMPLGNVWAWPTRALSYDQTLAGMKVTAAAVLAALLSRSEAAHPIDHGVWLEELLTRLAGQVSPRLGLAEPMPLLAALVAASPFDAALHHAFGQA